MEIIAFFIFFNDQYEKMNPKMIFMLCTRLKKGKAIHVSFSTSL